ncbi:hypothetical protein DFQ28_002068 [Apophysomyces sp. BC1034]|nr:hypothetical protein DFQ28_002068 [Apophysomyces sp. BC1034]
MPLQVIGAGYGRTGTYSLCMALEKLGYRTHHLVNDSRRSQLDSGVWLRAFENKDHEDEWEKVYGDFDAAVDNPTVPFYKELAECYPEAKVILTVRSADSWYNSLCNTMLKVWKLPVPECLSEPRRKMLELCQAIMLNGYFKDDLTREPNKEELCKMFNDHIEEVKQVIPPERLLIMELGEGWERLCKFLDKEIPDEPYPRSNETEGFVDKYEKAIEALRIEEMEHQRGLEHIE